SCCAVCTLTLRSAAFPITVCCLLAPRVIHTSTLRLHDALPIFAGVARPIAGVVWIAGPCPCQAHCLVGFLAVHTSACPITGVWRVARRVILTATGHVQCCIVGVSGVDWTIAGWVWLAVSCAWLG